MLREKVPLVSVKSTFSLLLWLKSLIPNFKCYCHEGLGMSQHIGSHKNSLNLLGEKYLNESHWPMHRIRLLECKSGDRPGPHRLVYVYRQVVSASSISECWFLSIPASFTVRIADIYSVSLWHRLKCVLKAKIVNNVKLACYVPGCNMLAAWISCR